jgi:hypothetical protein
MYPIQQPMNQMTSDVSNPTTHDSNDFRCIQSNNPWIKLLQMYPIQQPMNQMTWDVSNPTTNKSNDFQCIQSTLSHPIVIGTLVILFQLRPGLPSGLTYRFSYQNTVFISLLSHAYHVSRPIYPTGVCHPNYIWGGVQIREVLIMQSSPVFCFFLCLRFKYDCANSFQHAILRHIQCFILSREKSLTYTLQAKLTFFIRYWILNFLGFRREGTIFWAEWLL